MSGKRLGSFRAGDRSEYLALFALSRVAFACPVTRQEDFGVADFLCVLTREERGNVYPAGGFYVQVKSNDKPIDLDADAIRWISHHMDHALLVCVVDKDDGIVTFYSCARLWEALFLRAEPTSVRLLLAGDPPDPNPMLTEKEGVTRFDVHLGVPILRQSAAQLEADASLARSVLEPWLALDAGNIARRRTGRLATRVFSSWKTNERPEPTCKTSFFYGENYPLAEAALAPTLTALAHSYRHHKKGEQLKALCGLLNHLRAHLDSHGLEFADGKLKVE